MMLVAREIKIYVKYGYVYQEQPHFLTGTRERALVCNFSNSPHAHMDNNMETGYQGQRWTV